MYIKKLNVSHFGKFHHKTVHLEDGLNIVEGCNESGKSTIHAFIKGMLFGIDKYEEGEDNLYTKYQPWDNPDSYSGSIDIELNGSFYRINRNIYEATTDSTMFQLDSGKELSLKADQRLPILEGINKTTFQNTISIEQLKPETNGSFVSEVQNYYTNLTTAKHGNVSVSATLDNLEKDKAAVKLEAVKEEIIDIEDRLAEIEAAKEEKKALEEQIIVLEKQELSNDKKLEISDFMNNKQQIGDKAYAYQMLQDQIIEYEEAVNRRQYEKKKESAKSKTYEFLFIACVLALLGCIVGVVLQNTIFLIGSFVLLLFVLVAIFVVPMVLAKLKPAEKSVEEEEYLQLLLNKQQKLEAELITYQAQFGMELMTTLEFCKQIKSQLETQFKNLSNQLKEENSGREKRILEYKLKLKQLEEMLVTKEDLERKKADLYTLYEKKTKEIQMINLAMDKIKELSQTIQGSFGKTINQDLSNVVKQLTNGKYSRVYVDDKMNIFVEYDRNKIPIQKLSTGTAHQLYFALRMVFARQLFPKSKLPLILDETFVYYDNERLEEVLKILPKDQQIILFTCQDRERMLCDKLGIAYHYIKL